MEYIRTELQIEFEIRQIVAIHYYEFARGYIFSGERHDFWEFTYVDKGEVEIIADNQAHSLKQGEIIFHKPNEFHGIRANKKNPPNLIGMSFDCKSKALNFLENKIFSLNDLQRNTLADLVGEAFNAFQPPLDDPDICLPSRKQDAPFGSEQMIKNYLELLLIRLIRLGDDDKTKGRLSTSIKERAEEDIALKLIEHMERNVEANLTLDQLCSYSNIGKSQLELIFKNRTGHTVMKYYRKLKIEQAKTLIREDNCNITEISKKLGFSSVHYFSRFFNLVTGMPPSEYAKSVKSRVPGSGRK